MSILRVSTPSLILAIAVVTLGASVSSMAAPPDPCEMCAKCDQDGDGGIRISGFCNKKCPNGPVDPDGDTPPGACLVDDDTFKYTVTLTDNVLGASVHDGWSSARATSKSTTRSGLEIAPSIPRRANSRR